MPRRGEPTPGFIRRYGFADGPDNTLIAFWRTGKDATAFATRPEHRAAVRDLYQQRWQYSHFAAIWEMTSNHDRVIFCPRCQAVTPVADRRCSGCGAGLLDVYRAQPNAGRDASSGATADQPDGGGDEQC